PLSTHSAGARTDAGLPRVRISVHLRILGLRELRESGRGEDRRGDDAVARRRAARRPCRPGGRLRHACRPVPRPQLVGRVVGPTRLLHDAVRVSARRGAQRRFLDGEKGRVTVSSFGVRGSGFAVGFGVRGRFRGSRLVQRSFFAVRIAAAKPHPPPPKQPATPEPHPNPHPPTPEPTPAPRTHPNPRTHPQPPNHNPQTTFFDYLAAPAILFVN